MSEEPENEALALATVEELVRELGNRCEACVVAVYLLDAGKDDDKGIRFRFSGDRMISRGLVAEMADHVREPAYWEEPEEKP